MIRVKASNLSSQQVLMSVSVQDLLEPFLEKYKIRKGILLVTFKEYLEFGGTYSDPIVFIKI